MSDGGLSFSRCEGFYLQRLHWVFLTSRVVALVVLLCSLPQVEVSKQAQACGLAQARPDTVSAPAHPGVAGRAGLAFVSLWASTARPAQWHRLSTGSGHAWHGPPGTQAWHSQACPKRKKKKELGWGQTWTEEGKKKKKKKWAYGYG